jgi:hypothetical protein
MSPLAQLDSCTTCFNAKAAAAPAVRMPSIPLHDICPCYRPKMAQG